MYFFDVDRTDGKALVVPHVSGVDPQQKPHGKIARAVTVRSEVKAVLDDLRATAVLSAL